MAASGDSILTSTSESLHRKALKVTVCALCSEVGYTDAEEIAVETLTEMLQSFLTELTRSSKAYCELAGRTNPLATDVIISLIEMGQKTDTMPAYARRSNRVHLPAPSPVAITPEPKRLQVGSKRPHKSHILDCMPPFPDPHTYIKSYVHKASNFEYQTIREKAAAQKRDVERALTRFIAKTGDTENLFSDDPYAFPLIANKPKPQPYMDALMLGDHDPDVGSTEDEEKSSNRQLPSEPTQGVKANLERQDSMTPMTPLTPAGGGGTSSALDNLDADSLIDNPYLRPIRMPKIKASTKKSKY